MAESKILLSEEEAWTLFEKHARIEEHSSSSSSSLLHEVAREIAKECKGVGIAIQAVGTSLRGKSIDEWKIALERLRNPIKPKDMKIEEGLPDISACILLSYDNLRSKLAKSLFTACGVFPPDKEHSKEDIFNYAMDLNFCGDVKSLEMARSNVNEAIQELMDSYLLIQGDEGKNYVKMHKLVLHVALWVACNNGFKVTIIEF